MYMTGVREIDICIKDENPLFFVIQQVRPNSSKINYLFWK